MSLFYKNVLKGRDIDRVIVLGSGMSILDLTEEEKRHINRCKYVIAFNKFMAFYKKAGVLPTHIYFYDFHGHSFDFFRYILNVCRKNRLSNLTFITHKQLEGKEKYSLLIYIKSKIKDIFSPKRLNDRNLLYLKKPIRMFRYPNKSTIYTIDNTHHLQGGKWASNLQQPIFHYRGSLTSVLNICSILFPNLDVFLVGTDFNNSAYFFEEDIEKLDFEWKDFTYNLVKKEGVHFSYQIVEGKLMEDVFPFIVESMSKTKNDLYCTNPNSLLIKSGIKYKALLS